MDWTTLPDLVCVTLLIFAFASISRNSQVQQSKVWLAGWILIAAHFDASLFLKGSGTVANVADWIALSTLSGAGILFVWSAVPYRQRASSRWMLGGLLGSSTLYLGLVTLASPPLWVVDTSAALLGALPLAVTLTTIRRFWRPERWIVVMLYVLLAVFALVVQPRGNGAFLTVSGLLFVAYLACCIAFWFAYRMKTTGSFITIAGFLAWSLVFVVGPLTQSYLPQVHIESEVWNLPKYMVAIGMILLLLEDQIAHNRHLALHDELTGLANRRLFCDRLENALARAQRQGGSVALLLIDLDNFKQVNDADGHHVGDEVLKRVSSLFLTRIRMSDTVARTGGDEFSVILEGPVTRQQAREVAEALKSMLSEPLEVDGRLVQMGASIGLAMFPEDATAADALCIAADVAMYSEKNKIKQVRQDGRVDEVGEGVWG
ncbi:MAG: diguanylate cyclase domain-containing protein [Acidobacteriaceae bacterium]